jgi:hypothetical protein
MGQPDYRRRGPEVLFVEIGIHWSILLEGSFGFMDLEYQAGSDRLAWSK